MTLVLLLTAVTGAWADYTVTWEGTTLQGIAVSSNSVHAPNTTQTVEGITVTASNGDFFYNTTYPKGPVVIASSSANNGLVFSAENNIKSIAITFTETASYGSSMAFEAGAHTYQVSPAAKSFALPKNDSFIGITKVVFTLEGDAPVAGPEVAWDAAKKTGTFTMPAFDVEIAPIYAKAAAFATTGTEPEVKTLLPTAIEGIFAGTTDAIVKAGTVAMMGKTENPQGIVMYAVTSINQATAPELSAFSADVPTAENIADEGADVLVWYYIQGANTPDGQEATEENTFNDSEIFAEPIKVTVLPNKYDIQFNAANDNTIEAGKATVTVGGTDKTVTEGKLQGVKMGTKVTINAKQGYKFRKVEVKKGGAATLATALENGATVVIAFKYRDDGTCTFTNNNGTFTFVSGTGQLGGGNGPKQLSVENGKLIFKGSGTNSFTDRWSWYGFQVTFDPTANTYEVWKGSDLDVASFTSISVNGTDITDQLSELK